MTAGDVSADDFFGFDIRGNARDASHLQYLNLSTIFWVLSLFFVTILLSNLMVNTEIDIILYPSELLIIIYILFIDWFSCWRYSGYL